MQNEGDCKSLGFLLMPISQPRITLIDKNISFFLCDKLTKWASKIFNLKVKVLRRREIGPKVRWKHTSQLRIVNGYLVYSLQEIFL